MCKKIHGYGMAAGFLLCVLALFGCQRANYMEPEPERRTEESRKEEYHVVIHTETAAESSEPVLESEEVLETEALRPLPEIVSTASDAALVAKAYVFKPGETVEQSVVSELGEDAFFVQMRINEDIFSQMDGKSYKEGCKVPVSDLRYLRLLHCGFDGKTYVGELVCNRSISDDVLTIFHKLYRAGYPIEKMILPDNYEDADILLSSGDNNTAAFNDRNTVGKTTKSLHARGIAIDINPLYNPYIMYQPDGSYQVAPENGSPYADRSRENPYRIDKNDLCYRLFTEAGFTWGGIWNNPDYMHFFRK